MSAAIWIAAPPEAHSALLNSGPGPGPLLSAAEAWHSLSAEYAAAAEDLTALLAGVQAGGWRGPSAERYVAAHAAYLEWLTQASTDSAAMAAQHGVAAAAYTTAVAAMPTLAELAANHAAHATLLATNFFGINTIPIALNEADYARMWIQAATTMSTYQAVSGAAVAAAPGSTSAPHVLKSNASEARSPTPDHGGVFQQLLQFLENPIGTLQRIASAFAMNPAAALSEWGPLLFTVAFNTVPWPLPFYLGPALAMALPIAIQGGLNLLGEMAAQTPPSVVMPATESPPPPAVRVEKPNAEWAAPGIAPTASGLAAPAPPPPAAAATAPAPVAASSAISGYPVLVTPSDPVGGPPLTGRGGAAPPTVRAPAAGAVTAVTRERTPARRRRRAALRGFGNEFMDVEEPDTAATDQSTAAAESERGARLMGFTGTAATAGDARPAGLTALTGDACGGGPTMPMLPDNWDGGPDRLEGPGEGGPGQPE